MNPGVTVKPSSSGKGKSDALWMTTLKPVPSVIPAMYSPSSMYRVRPMPVWNFKTVLHEVFLVNLWPLSNYDVLLTCMRSNVRSEVVSYSSECVTVAMVKGVYAIKMAAKSKSFYSLSSVDQLIILYRVCPPINHLLEGLRLPHHSDTCVTI